MTPVVNVVARSGKVRRPHVAGLSLIEVVMSLFIFLMMALLVAVVLPVATRNTRYSNTYSHAVSIGQRKIDQLQEAGWSKLNATDLFNMGVIDSSTPNTDGNVTIYTFTNNNGTNTAAKSFDNIQDYFPGGSAVTGTIRIEPWENGNVVINSTTQSVMRKATVTLTWKEATGPTQTFMMTALISQVSME